MDDRHPPATCIGDRMVAAESQTMAVDTVATVAGSRDCISSYIERPVVSGRDPITARKRSSTETMPSDCDSLLLCRGLGCCG